MFSSPLFIPDMSFHHFLRIFQSRSPKRWSQKWPQLVGPSFPATWNEWSRRSLQRPSHRPSQWAPWRSFDRSNETKATEVKTKFFSGGIYSNKAINLNSKLYLWLTKLCKNYGVLNWCLRVILCFGFKVLGYRLDMSRCHIHVTSCVPKWSKMIASICAIM